MLPCDLEIFYCLPYSVLVRNTNYLFHTRIRGQRKSGCRNISTRQKYVPTINNNFYTYILCDRIILIYKYTFISISRLIFRKIFSATVFFFSLDTNVFLNTPKIALLFIFSVSVKKSVVVKFTLGPKTRIDMLCVKNYLQTVSVEMS